MLEDGTIDSHNGIVGLIRVTSPSGDFVVEETFSQVYVEPFIPELGDVNADGIINVLDVVGLIMAITNETENFAEDNPQADLTGDGIVNILDIVQLVSLILNSPTEESE